MLLAQAGFQPLTGFDDRIEHLGDGLVEALLGLRAALSQLSQPSDRARP